MVPPSSINTLRSLPSTAATICGLVLHTSLCVWFPGLIVGVQYNESAAP